MSIQSEINRLIAAKNAIIAQIEAKGVTVPENVTLDELSDYAAQIQVDPSQGCTANADGILAPLTAVVDGDVITGTMADRAGMALTPKSIRNLVDTDKVRCMGFINCHIDDTTAVDINYAALSQAISLTADKIKKGEVILGITGTYEGTDTSDATATAADIRSGKTAYVNGQKVTGTLPYVNALTSSSVTPYATGNYIAYTTRAEDAIYASKSILLGSQAQVAAAGGVTSAKLVKGQTAFGITGTGRSWPLCWATGDPGYGDGVPQTWRGEIKINAPYCELNSFIELCRLALIDVGLVTPGGNANAALLNIKTTYDTLKQSYIRLFIAKEASN